MNSAILLEGDDIQLSRCWYPFLARLQLTAHF